MACSVRRMGFRRRSKATRTRRTTFNTNNTPNSIGTSIRAMTTLTMVEIHQLEPTKGLASPKRRGSAVSAEPTD